MGSTTNTSAESFILPFPEETLKETDKPTEKQAQVLSQILKHHYRSDTGLTYPSEILSEAHEDGHLEDTSRQMITKIFGALEKKNLIRESDESESTKPGNVSKLYDLTDGGLLFATLYAEENGLTEEEIREAIEEALTQRGYSEKIIEVIKGLRDLQEDISPSLP